MDQLFIQGDDHPGLMEIRTENENSASFVGGGVPLVLNSEITLKHNPICFGHLDVCKWNHILFSLLK